MKGRKINLVTLGCSKNIVDSEKLLKQFQSGGYEIMHDNNDYSEDIAVINTCGFINDAREESINTILRYVQAKERGLIKKIYVIGCLSQRYMESLKKEIPEVDNYFGVNDINSILKEFGVCFRQDFNTDRILTGPGHYAYLKVSEGCDRNCAFCAIPFIRGRCISRPLEELVEEARLLAECGVKELILIAQDLTYYGLDLYKTQKLPDLISGLLEKGYFDWIRLHYLYPAGFPEKLIPVIRDNPVICNYIDLPVQHISDRMLKIMRRSHGRHETEKLLTKIRKEIPDACIRTTMIVGHPGEREEDFRELMRFTEDFRFDRLGVFTYSDEEGTYSNKKYKDNIPSEIKEARLSELMELQQTISAGLNEKRVGQTLKVLTDRREGDFIIGRTEYDSPEIDQEVLINSKHDLKPGTFYNIRITKALDFDLLGEPESDVKERDNNGIISP